MKYDLIILSNNLVYWLIKRQKKSDRLGKSLVSFVYVTAYQQIPTYDVFLFISHSILTIRYLQNDTNNTVATTISTDFLGEPIRLVQTFIFEVTCCPPLQWCLWRRLVDVWAYLVADLDIFYHNPFQTDWFSCSIRIINWLQNCFEIPFN